MKYFLPVWHSDKIDNSWNPNSDLKRSNKKMLKIWEVFEKPPMDGLLVSKSRIEQNKTELEIIKKMDIHEFLNFDGTIFGDCGAFSYIEEEKPPYDPLDTLEFYNQCGFDLGATVDHLIVPQFFEQKELRFKITKENALLMFKTWEKKYQNFELVGVVQGWDIPSRLNLIKEYLEVGFKYIALGGLVRSPTRYIKELLLAIKELLKDKKEKPKIHLFGIARLSLIPIMKECFVVSFDSSSFLRKAWLSLEDNYYLGKEKYVAIRIPLKFEKAKTLLEQLRRIDKKEEDIDKVLPLILEIDANKKVEKEIIKTLSDKPWKKCDCPICKSIGIDVVIFRGGERNMRRGFHNIYQFYKMIKEW